METSVCMVMLLNSFMRVEAQKSPKKSLFVKVYYNLLVVLNMLKLFLVGFALGKPSLRYILISFLFGISF